VRGRKREEREKTGWGSNDKGGGVQRGSGAVEGVRRKERNEGRGKEREG